MTRARDLTAPYPSLPTDAPAAEVARILAEEEVDVVLRGSSIHPGVAAIKRVALTGLVEGARVKKVTRLW